MKRKSVSLLVKEVGKVVSAPSSRTFKVPCSDAAEYINKILIKEGQLHKPSAMESFVSLEMKDYPQRSGEQVERMDRVASNIKNKAESLEKHLNSLEMKFSFLMLQDVMGLLRLSHKVELGRIRNKLMKLENCLAFKLESDDLEPHMQESLEEFWT